MSLNLPTETYDLSVKMHAFKPVTKRIVVANTNRQTIAIVLQVGGCPPGCPVEVQPTFPTGTGTYSKLPVNGVIPDEGTAAAVAEAVLRPIFGEQEIGKFDPYHAQLTADVWTVYGTLRQNSRSGTPMLRIQRSDGKILEIWYSQ